MNIDLSHSGTATNWLESLYREKAAGLALYGRALGLSHAESEDMLQETFVALLELPRPPANPSGYCLRAFRNRALNHRRGLWRRIGRELLSRTWFENEPTQDADDKRLMAALASLPREQREVIVLKVWHSNTFDEIGSLLEISPNTAAGRYRYGLEKLRNSLRRDYYEEKQRFGETLAFLEPPRSVGQD